MKPPSILSSCSWCDYVYIGRHDCPECHFGHYCAVYTYNGWFRAVWALLWQGRHRAKAEWLGKPPAQEDPMPRRVVRDYASVKHVAPSRLYRKAYGPIRAAVLVPKEQGE